MNQPGNSADMSPPTHGNTHEQERAPSRLAYMGRFLHHLLEMFLAVMLGTAIRAALLSLMLKPMGYGLVCSC